MKVICSKGHFGGSSYLREALYSIGNASIIHDEDWDRVFKPFFLRFSLNS